jgi:hypothetical protein
MALLAAHGEISPMPALAIFADTGWEPAAVYRWLEQLRAMLPFPIVTVGSGNLRAEQVTARLRAKRSANSRWASLPYYVDNGSTDVEGRMRRQCTAEYKIAPIEQYMRRTIMGLAPRQRAPRTPQITQWRGISVDEAHRMKPSREPWFVTRYPLAMELRMTRQDCLHWMQRNGYPQPPRSACIGCPFHSDHEWREMRDRRPDEWADAVDFDARIRKAGGMRGDAYLHRSLRPLAEVDLRTAQEVGQTDLFGDECEGMCGV